MNIFLFCVLPNGRSCFAFCIKVSVVCSQIWTEVSGGLGAVNFQTGMGGFLQAVISGYGGIRLQVESLQFQQPRLIPGTSKLTFKNLNYLGTVFDYVIETSHIQLTVRSIGSIQLSLNASGIVSDLKPGESFSGRARRSRGGLMESRLHRR